MAKLKGRIIFILIIWFFSLKYYWECLALAGRMEKLTIDIAFWLMTVFAAWELFSLVKNILKEKTRQPLFSREAISRIIRDKRSHLVVAVILYVNLIPLTGFYLTSFVAFCCFSLIIGRGRGIRMVPIMAAGGMVMAIIYGIFSYLLQISLPPISIFAQK